MFVLVCYRTLCGSSWKSWRARRTLRQSLWDFNFNVGSSDNTVHKVPISIHWLFIIFPNKQMQKKLGQSPPMSDRPMCITEVMFLSRQGVPQLPRLLAESSLRLALWWEPQGSIITAHWPLEVDEVDMIFGSLEPKATSRWTWSRSIPGGACSRRRWWPVQSQVSKGWGLLRQALEIAENTCKKNCSAAPRSCWKMCWLSMLYHVAILHCNESMIVL